MLYRRYKRSETSLRGWGYILQFYFKYFIKYSNHLVPAVLNHAWITFISIANYVCCSLLSLNFHEAAYTFQLQKYINICRICFIQLLKLMLKLQKKSLILTSICCFNFNCNKIYRLYLYFHQFSFNILNQAYCTTLLRFWQHYLWPWIYYKGGIADIIFFCWTCYCYWTLSHFFLLTECFFPLFLNLFCCRIFKSLFSPT